MGDEIRPSRLSAGVCVRVDIFQQELLSSPVVHEDLSAHNATSMAPRPSVWYPNLVLPWQTAALTADSTLQAVLLAVVAALLFGWLTFILEREIRLRFMGRMSLRIEEAVAAHAEGLEFGRIAFWRHLLLPLRAYNPSIKSVLLAVLLPSLVYALLWLFNPASCSSLQLGEHLAVQGVVFGSVFGVVLFVVGLTGPSATQGFKRAEVVLRKTYLFPLMVGTAVSMRFTLLRGPSLLAWAATVGVLLAGVWVLYHLLSLLLGPSRI